jgi:hypothetical protein
VSKRLVGSDLPKFTKHLRTWGEAGVVKTRSLATPKVADHGVPCMFVGYSKTHPGDTYCMYVQLLVVFMTSVMLFGCVACAIKYHCHPKSSKSSPMACSVMI